MNPIHILATVIMVIAATLPIMLLIKMRVEKRFQEEAIHSTAEILQVERRRGYRSNYYIMKVCYKTTDTFMEFTGETVLGNNNKVGDEISIWYKRDDPTVFKTDWNKRLRWVLAFTLLFFVLVCWASVWLLGLEI